MKALLQRVTSASVSIEGTLHSQIEDGLLVLLGVAQGDNEEDAEKLARRVCNYRMFADSQGRMNLSLQERGGAMLVVSQFTLCADTEKGRRPGFSHSAEPQLAENLYKQFVAHCSDQIAKVETGVFAADMQVSLINDGPVTFMLES